MGFCETVRDSGHFVADVAQKGDLPIFEERHYTVDQVAEILNVSSELTRKLFEREPGVLVIPGDGGRGKRRYRTMRIPQSVVERVYRRLRNPDLTAARPKAYATNSRGPQVSKAPGSL